MNLEMHRKLGRQNEVPYVVERGSQVSRMLYKSWLVKKHIIKDDDFSQGSVRILKTDVNYAF